MEFLATYDVSLTDVRQALNTVSREQRMPDTINSHEWSTIEEYCNALKAFEEEAPCDFLLCTKMKSKIRWKRFNNVEKVQKVSQRVLDKITRNDFQKSFKTSHYHWKQRHNYFEVDESQN